MKDVFKKIAGSKVSFALKIEEKDLKKAEHSVVESFRQHVSLKGFRKGNVPDDVVREQVGEERLKFESLNRAIEKQYQAFVMEHKLRVVSQPSVDFTDINARPVEIQVEVEVFPEVDLGKYEKIKLGPVNVEVKDKEIDEVIERFMRDFNLGKTVDRKAKDGDKVTVDFAGKDKDGNVIPKTEGKAYPFVLGTGQFLPDLEKAYVGMKPGDEKTGVKVKFPKDYPSEDVAGKKVPFDIKLISITEVKADDIDEAGIEAITGTKKKKDEFRGEVKTLIEQQKSNEEKRKKVGEYHEKLYKAINVELPASWIEREVATRMTEIEKSPQYQQDPEGFWKAVGKKEADLRKEFRQQAEKDLAVFLALSEIVDQKSIELDKDELEKAQQLARRRLGNEQQSGADHDAELQRAQLNLRIDKYLEGLML